MGHMDNEFLSLGQESSSNMQHGQTIFKENLSHE